MHPLCIFERDDALVIALERFYPGNLGLNPHSFRIQQAH